MSIILSFIALLLLFAVSVAATRIGIEWGKRYKERHP